MILEHAQKHWLVANVHERGLMKVVESVHKALIATEFRDQCFDIVRHKAGRGVSDFPPVA